MSNDSLSDISISHDRIVSPESIRDENNTKKTISFQRRLSRLLWHFFARQFMLYCVIALKIAGWIGRKRRPIDDKGCEIMLTGRFDSKNWILAHLVPLAQSKECSRLWMVSTNPVPEIPKVEAIYPPKWMMRSFGATPSRLLTFLWAAIRIRPHVVGGFHIMLNGITAIIAGRLVGACSMYFNVGGPIEIQDGGIHNIEGHFLKMETPDAVVEKRILKILSECHKIITMGSRAVTFYRSKGINADCHIISGGIDSSRFYPAKEKAVYDCIVTGRLVEIKRIDIFLRAVKILKDTNPEIKTLIIGDGPERSKLEQLAVELGIDKNVNFAGFHNDIENWLRKSSIFVLTSDSEGLSLSMMEAMMCGLPVVVSDVGDLADLVEDGRNGYLVPRRCPELLAERIMELLTDGKKLETFSKAAYNSAMQYTMQAAVRRWDDILADFSTK
jgi:L-malate glycosyltransferase